MSEAVAVVNANLAKIEGTLRAAGAVDGFFTSPGGGRRSFHLDGTLFYLAPCYLRFDLKTFGDRQMLFGSNKTHYWLYSKEEERYVCGRHDASDELPSDLPMRPDQIVDALGLTPLPTHWLGSDGVRRVQRVEEETQQILFLARSNDGRLTLEKEYWLDRFVPQLVRRVLFRGAEGVTEMSSRLDGYRPLTPGGPYLPWEMVADWPTSRAQLRFHVSRWTSVKDVGPISVQFATPKECSAP